MRKSFYTLALLASAAPVAPAFAQSAASPFTTATRYDAMGRVTGTISADPDGIGGPLGHQAVRNTYAPGGELVRVEKGELSGWQSEAVAPSAWSGLTVHHMLDTVYDVSGRKIRETASSGGTALTLTQYSYDVLGRLECTAVRMNPAVFSSLPASACTLGAQGSQGPDRITRNGYDAADQLVQVKEAVGTSDETSEVVYSYTPNGKRQFVIDGNGNRGEFRYDRYDRLLRWVFPSASPPTAYNGANADTALATAGTVNEADYEAYAQDGDGNLIALRKRDGRRIDYAYDALNRVTSKTYPNGGARSVYYSYDLRGLQLSARYDSMTGEGVGNVYDNLGRLHQATTNMGGSSVTLTSRYDANGNRGNLEHPNGVMFSHEYDGLDRLDTLRENAYSVISRFWYNGKGERWVTYRGNAQEGSNQNYDGLRTFYAFDGLGRLAGTSFDPLGTAHDHEIGLVYNPASQIIERTGKVDAFAWSGHTARSDAYTVNGRNQYTSAGGRAVSHDPNGNVTSDGETTFGYDIENRLISASGAKNAALAYDPLGRLWQVTAGGATTRFLYDGDELVADYDSAGNVVRRYVHGPNTDEALLQYEGSSLAMSARRHLIPDERGSIIAIADAAGNVTNINSYDEYGRPAATNVGRFQYTGQTWIPEVGLYYYKARFYDPRDGRFMQVDPVGYEDGPNLYAYAAGDPVSRTDPTGESSCLSRIEGKSNCTGVSALEYGIRRAGELANKLSERMRGFERRVVSTLISGFTLGDRSPSQISREIDEFLENPVGNAAAVAAAFPVTRSAAGAAATRGLVAGTLRNVTQPGSRLPNFAVQGNLADFAAGLLRRGFQGTRSSDGQVMVFVKGDMKYSLRGFSRSTKGPTVDVYRNNRPVAKVRLKP